MNNRGGVWWLAIPFILLLGLQAQSASAIVLVDMTVPFPALSNARQCTPWGIRDISVLEPGVVRTKIWLMPYVGGLGWSGGQMVIPTLTQEMGAGGWSGWGGQSRYCCAPLTPADRATYGSPQSGKWIQNGVEVGNPRPGVPLYTESLARQDRKLQMQIAVMPRCWAGMAEGTWNQDPGQVRLLVEFFPDSAPPGRTPAGMGSPVASAPASGASVPSLGGSPSQRLHHRVIARHSNKCMDGMSHVHQEDCRPGDSQAWSFLQRGQDYSLIVAKHSGKCLDVAGAATHSGQRVQEWDCHGGDNQLWKVVPRGQGSFLIVAKHSGKCLDVAGGGTQSGVFLQQYDCHGGDNQLWKIEQLPASPGGRDSAPIPTQPSFPAGCAQEVQVYTNGNIAGVQNGPTQPTRFQLPQAVRVTYLMTYHWNNARGQVPGTIGLRHQDGTVYGPWQATSAPGQGGVPNAYWIVRPNAALKPGTYTFVDSHPGTWAQNAQSNGQGMVEVKGCSGVADAPPGGSPARGRPEERAAQDALRAREQRAQQLFIEGGELEAQGNYAGAIVSYRQALALVNDQEITQRVTVLQQRLGVSEQEKARRARAEALWDECVNFTHRNRLIEALAKCRESLGYWSSETRVAAVRELESSANQTSALCENLRAAGYGLQQQGRLGNALEKYREVQQHCPSAAMANFIRQLEAHIAQTSQASPRPPVFPSQGREQGGRAYTSVPRSQQAGTGSAASPPAGSPTTLTVRASIDGRSHLVIQGNTVYWKHYDWAAPGRLSREDQPTYLNGTPWHPTWPDKPDRENRSCNGCESSRFAGIPGLAQQSHTVGVSPVRARGSVRIVQQPEARNHYTLIVELNDNAAGSDDWYEVHLVYQGSR